MLTPAVPLSRLSIGAHKKWFRDLEFGKQQLHCHHNAQALLTWGHDARMMFIVEFIESVLGDDDEEELLHKANMNEEFVESGCAKSILNDCATATQQW